MGRKRVIGSRLDAQFTLRLPAELLKTITEAADRSGRSKNTEMLLRLEDSFEWEAANGKPAPSGLDDIKRELDEIKKELARTQEMILAKK